MGKEKITIEGVIEEKEKSFPENILMCVVIYIN